MNCDSLFLIPDRNTITVQSNFSLKVNSFHGNQKYIYFFWFAFSTNKFKDLVFTFRFLWLHSLYLLLPSLKLFLFLPTSSDGSFQLGLKGYSFFSRISSGKCRWRNGYKQRYKAFDKFDINNKDGTMTLGLTSIYVSRELISHTGTAIICSI